MSQSLRGIHIFGKGKVPPHGCRNDALGLEFYTSGRYVALTGISAQGDASIDFTPQLAELVRDYFPPSATANGDHSLTDQPVPEWNGPLDDTELIRRAMMSGSAASKFGGKASFADLWQNNVSALTLSYPSTNNQYDSSACDAALASHLSFWTGKHGERIRSLMLRSGLMRDKYERPDYLPRTISEIIARGGDVLCDKSPEPLSLPPPATSVARQTVIEGEVILGQQSQLDLFAGCVYVRGRNVVLTPGGHLMKQEQFRVTFGGRLFVMDNANGGLSKNAWEAFTDSKILRPLMADSTCFRPDLPPAEIIDPAGRRMVNTWWPAKIRRIKGDATPFLDLLARMLPVQRDRDILLAYMAACVQHMGVKFSWCPVIQGCEGNGKTTLSACVSEAVGQHYCHWPKADDLASDFNGWVADKVFIALEELHSQDHQAAVLEKLKTLVTGGMGMQVQFKNVDQESRAICANFICTTNYQNAIARQQITHAGTGCSFAPNNLTPT